MRRDTLISALGNVRSALVSSKAYVIAQYLLRIRAGDKDRSHEATFMKDALESYARFMISYEGFGPAEKLILKKFDLAELTSAETWFSPSSPKDKLTLSGRIRQVVDLLPAFIDLLTRDADNQSIIVEKVDNKHIQQMETRKLTFLIRDSESPTLTLSDLGSILSDIENLFHAISRIQNVQPSELIVTALDSGSDKSIDVVGVASAIDKLSAFVLEAWDRIRFARASKLRASIKTASEGISLLSELKAAQEKGAISPDEGEKIRRTIVKSMDELLAKGVYTKEMETAIPVPPSQIPYQRTKLITHYSDRAAQSASTPFEADGEPPEKTFEED